MATTTRTTRPRFVDDATAAAIGRIAILEELVETLTDELRKAQDAAFQQEGRMRFLEERLATLQRPRSLLTEKEAAAELRVSLRTMHNWRNETPARVPFVLMEGGDIRYRVADIETYLKSRERGTLKKAA